MEHLTELIQKQGEAFAGFKDDVYAKINSEVKEREALESRFNQIGLGPTDAVGVDSVALGAERKALASFARSDGGGDPTEIKALSTGSDPDGGYFSTPARSGRMTERLWEASPIRQLARIEVIERGDSFEEPYDIDEAGADFIGENDARPTTDTPEVGMLKIPLQEITANPKVSNKLLDTANFDVGGWLDRKITNRFARIESASYITGNGMQRPRGITSYPTTAEDDFTRDWGKLQHTTTGAASSFASSNPADALRDCMWSLRAPYRAGAAWIMNSNTASLIDKFKNGNGDYIWRDGMTSGAPPSLLGYPVYFDENMPDVAAGAYPIACGQFNIGYVIIEKPGLKMLRDPFTTKGQTYFFAYRRMGGDVANFDAIKLLKVAAS